MISRIGTVVLHAYAYVSGTSISATPCAWR